MDSLGMRCWLMIKPSLLKRLGDSDVNWQKDVVGRIVAMAKEASCEARQRFILLSGELLQAVAVTELVHLGENNRLGGAAPPRASWIHV